MTVDHESHRAMTADNKQASKSIRARVLADAGISTKQRVSRWGWTLKNNRKESLRFFWWNLYGKYLWNFFYARWSPSSVSLQKCFSCWCRATSLCWSCIVQVISQSTNDYPWYDIPNGYWSQTWSRSSRSRPRGGPQWEISIFDHIFPRVRDDLCFVPLIESRCCLSLVLYESYIILQNIGIVASLPDDEVCDWTIRTQERQAAGHQSGSDPQSSLS